MKNRIVHLGCVALAAALFCFSSPASAQAPDYDFQWATIGDAGNAAYQGSPFGELAGRGGVPYEYRMSKLEITSAQWLEFVNIFAPQSPNPGNFLRPSYSGMTDTATPGQYVLRQDVADAAMLPVFGVTWREAAMYCNWLCNGKSHDWSAIQNGAYDVSTFGFNPNHSFTDQVTHNPGAQFWIPTLDEWIKAAYYDPNHDGPGQAGWWEYPYASNDQPIPGLPGIGQTSAGLINPPGYANVMDIPLGAYSNVSSPWGLLDVSGGAREWTEETESGLWHYSRGLKGAYPGSTGLSLLWDRIDVVDYDSPDGISYSGLRIASAIPASGGLLFAVVAGLLQRTPRRRERGSIR